MPSAASSTATSPEGGSPTARTARPGRVVVLSAVCTVQADVAAAALTVAGAVVGPA